MSDRSWVLTNEGYWVNLSFARAIKAELDQTPSSYWIEFGQDDGVRVTRTPENISAVDAFLASRLVSTEPKDGSVMSLEAGYEMMKGTLESISKTLGRAPDPK